MRHNDPGYLPAGCVSNYLYLVSYLQIYFFLIHYVHDPAGR